MPKPSSSADRIRKSHPELWQRFTALADACHEAGPLDEKTRRLIKLALAIAAGTEGGTQFRRSPRQRIGNNTAGNGARGDAQHYDSRISRSRPSTGLDSRHNYTVVNGDNLAEEIRYVD
jgi:hypothetical protein